MSLSGIWREVRDLVTGEYPAGTLTSPTVSLIHSSMSRTSAGVTMNERVAEGLPAIYACVHVISETAGSLPLKLFRRLEGGGKEPDQDHPLYSVLHDLTNPEMTAFQFREMLTRHLAIWGRAYAQIERDARGRVTAMWPLHPSRMFVERDGLNRKVFKYWMAQGDFKTFVFSPERTEILHLHMNCDDGLDGRSPLAINAESLGITKATEDYTGGWFANGAVPGIIATSPRRLSPKAKENIRQSWLRRFAGAANTNKLAILEEGITIDVVGVNPEQSQLAALRGAQIEAAARIYRVPLFLIQNQTKDTSWGSGIEQQMLGFVNLTMMPWFQQWQQTLKRDALSRKSFRTHDPIFVVDALVRGDIKTRFEAYSTARQNGIYNGDEIRELEDLNPIDGGAGQVFWQPANMMSLGNVSPVTTESDDDDDSAGPAVPSPDGVM